MLTFVVWKDRLPTKSLTDMVQKFDGLEDYTEQHG